MLKPVSLAVNSAAPDVRGLRQCIDARLAELMPVDEAARSDGLPQVMRHAVLSPGKRLRPTLAVLVGREWGVASTALLDVGCALEMVHCASLIFDDLPAMDNATVRRGRPTVHVVHGVDVAMLAAIALLARSFALLSRLPQVSAEQRTALVAVLAEAVGEAGLACGQPQDVQGVAQGRDLDSVSHTSALKTGVLFRAAILMTATLAAVEDERLQRLLAFAKHFGQAFQIADELSDAGDDAGQATCASLLGTAAAQSLLQTHLDSAVGQLSSPRSPLALWVRGLFVPLRCAAISVG